MIAWCVYLALLPSFFKIPCWKVQHLGDVGKVASSWSYTPENTYNGLGLQFLKGEYGILAYVNVYSGAIQPLEQQPELSIVAFSAHNETHVYKARRLKGDQRLMLPEEATKKLLHFLENGEEAVTVALNGYASVVPLTRFPSSFKSN